MARSWACGAVAVQTCLDCQPSVRAGEDEEQGLVKSAAREPNSSRVGVSADHGGRVTYWAIQSRLPAILGQGQVRCRYEGLRAVERLVADRIHLGPTSMPWDINEALRHAAGLGCRWPQGARTIVPRRSKHPIPRTVISSPASHPHL